MVEKNHMFINQFLNNIKARTEKYMQNFNSSKNGNTNSSVEESSKIIN
jgi:hypothetical protein